MKVTVLGMVVIVAAVIVLFLLGMYLERLHNQTKES
jgi:cell division protein FtsN